MTFIPVTNKVEIEESLPAGDNNIGNVDIASGTVTAELSATDNAVLDAMQTALEAVQAALEATLAVSGTVDLGATDNAVLDAIQTAIEACQTALEGTITVDGTVTANLGATDTGYLLAIKTALEILDNAISGSEMQVDIVSSAAIPVTDNAGSLTVDGTVTANLSATDNAVLDAAVTALEAIQTAIEATLTISGTVTANLSATDNAVLDAMVVDLAAIEVLLGTIDADTGAIKTAIEILDNAISGSEMQVDVVAALPAGENHLGDVGMPDDTIAITVSLDTSAYADGDVLFATQEIANAVRNNGETCILQSIHVIDIDDQGEEMDLVFFNANTSLGSENSAPDIDDTEVLTTLGKVNISADDYIDLGANQIATIYGIGLALEAGASTTSLYVAGITRGTPTHTASGLKIIFGFLRN